MRHRLSTCDPGLHALLARLYEAGSVDLATSPEPYVTRPGRRLAWALDLRRPLLSSEFLLPVAAALSDRLAAAAVGQVAGAGYGAAPLVCGLVALGRGIDGLIARGEPKERGFIRAFEGELAREREVAIVDDIVNTGRTSLRLASALREAGYEVSRVLCLFCYGWGEGRRRLAGAGLSLEALATLERRRGRFFAVRRLAPTLGLG
jgi:orotate phosphoribosyltransferase